MTWNDALMLVEYYRPTYLPSIDDTKSPQVTSEVSLEQYSLAIIIFNIIIHS